jgi:hypothetical protein
MFDESVNRKVHVPWFTDPNDTCLSYNEHAVPCSLPDLYSYFPNKTYPSSYFPFPKEVDGGVPDFSTCTSDIKCKSFNSLTAKSVLAGEKKRTFWYLHTQFLRRNGTLYYIQTKTWHAKIYFPTQCTNWQILTSAKKIQLLPFTNIIDAASSVKIVSMGKMESMRVQRAIKLCEWIKIWQETTVL